MPSNLIFREIAGFRLVTADPVRLATFYAAIGFSVGDAGVIPEAEMAMFGLPGGGRRSPLRLGPSRLDLDAFDHAGRPYPAPATAADFAFQHLALVTDDASAAWERARQAGAVPISRESPVTLPASSGGVTAMKFRDPEGHPLEFLEFVSGSHPEWRGAGILGVDHSAISVADIVTSKEFYSRNGLIAGAATLNTGSAQIALDGLDDVAVDVLPMNPAASPPHVELLGYRHPVGKQREPVAVNDIAATRIIWKADCEALLRDPDGHLHQLNQ